MSGRVVAVLVGVALIAGAAAILLVRGGPPGRDPIRPPQVRSLLRQGTVATLSRTADLDGDGVPEVVLASRSTMFAQFQLPAQYLDVYAHRRGSWQRILDGTAQAPPGSGTPARMLDTPGPELVSRLVDSIQVLDLAKDGAPEVAVGILTAGAGEGPLELWILSMAEDGGLRTEYFVRTTRGGQVVPNGDRIILEFGVYRPQDAACCPSRIERQVIGYDEATGSIGLLERTRRKSGQP
jgi:hypothetical protein